MSSPEKRKQNEEQGLCGNCGIRPIILHKKQCSKCNSSASRQHAELKRIIFEHYGGRCVCCGELEPMFLSVDHINNDGAEDRRKDNTGGSNFYRRIVKGIKSGNAPTDLQLLCRNCNWGKHVNGGICPHLRKYM